MSLFGRRLVAAMLGSILLGISPGNALAEDVKAASPEGVEESHEQETLAWLAEEPAPDAAAEAAFEAWIAERDAILSGRKEAVAGWHDAVRDIHLQGEAADSVFAREVYRRVALDQYGRASGFFTLAHSERVAADLGHHLEGHSVQGFMDRIVKSLMRTDLENAAFLDVELAGRGGHWWTISEVGEEVSRYIWLIAQHADNNRAFQRRVLVLMAPLAEAGEVNRQDYGFLSDRLSVADGRPQTFGSQGRCAGPGNWEAFEIEAPVDAVNARRAAFDFAMTFEQNKARLDLQCSE